MRFTSKLMALGGLLVVPFALAAQESTQGTYSTQPGMMDTMELPNGNMLEHSTYTASLLSDNPHSPLGNISSQCAGDWVKTMDGGTVSRAGACFNMNDAGDGYSLWWRQTDSESEACPMACGVFGIYGGYGKYAGLSGDGSWELTTMFPNGAALGVWKASHSM